MHSPSRSRSSRPRCSACRPSLDARSRGVASPKHAWPTCVMVGVRSPRAR
ncbi:hypothetical protein ACFPRL_22385 [Pseudoclavibacter helvolus]